jgi:hypothetical protein
MAPQQDMPSIDAHMPLIMFSAWHGWSEPGPPVRSNALAGRAWLALFPFALSLLASAPSHAADFELLSVGVRARVGEKRVLGEVAPESFRAYDVMATIRLPWEAQLPASLSLHTRLLASAGALHGADKTALTLSLIPALAVGTAGGGFTLDAGIGLAALSEHRYAQQDFGGPLQFALTLGASVAVHERVAVGYRFMHYSDAGAWGKGTTGADFHMIELSYRF